MHFASLEYALLFSLVFGAYWALGRAHLPRLVLLLAASYTFYAWWSAYYLLLIIASSAIDYLVGGRLHHSQEPRRRKAWLLVSLVGNLGLLGIFKYFNFFSASVGALLAHLGVTLTPPQIDVLLPVGISFYTFQSMSYTIDIYRRKLDPEQTPLPFVVFVAFFPQLVAGPIVRAKELLPQLACQPQLTARDATRGYLLIMIGLLKKAVIADLLAVNLVDRVFETPALYTSMEVLLGVYGYALQIYCDFSAYSDIAIGSALLLGLTLPKNFDHPYRASNLQDFWRRWHISLSSWLRDYLYIPLGGSAGSSWQTYRNLAITMLLGGLWHGAAWTFVVWGAMHGVMLGLTRAAQRSGVLALLRQHVSPRLWQLVGIAITFHFVCLTWIFFRSPDFAHAAGMLLILAEFTGGSANISPLVWSVLALGAMTHVIPDGVARLEEEGIHRLPAPLMGALLFATVTLVRYAASSEAVPFIYFQF
ncbi:MAG: MBOAT family protein [Deltaproteobacteria bacterium]|nr:MBOAT family protein [Deltaproteobacteria bacterium]